MNPFRKITLPAARLVVGERAPAVGLTVPVVRKAKPRPRVLPRPVDDIALPASADVLGRVICPYPPAILNPNGRAHWSKRSPVAKAYRQECWALALAAGLHMLVVPAGPIRVRLDFFPPDHVRRDDDNAVAAFKAGRDGIADAMKVDDSRFATVAHFHPEPRACVVVSILAGDA